MLAQYLRCLKYRINGLVVEFAYEMVYINATFWVFANLARRVSVMYIVTLVVPKMNALCESCTH
jgi:hypothetical protein